MRAVIALLPLMLGLAACDRQASAPPQAGATGPAAPAGPARVIFDESRRGTPAPATSFTGSDGKAVTLAAFRGRPVLVNLWATWCGPCIKELPGLDARAADAGGRIAFIAVNQMDEPAKAAAWWRERGLKSIRPYAEPGGRLSSDFGSGMLPTTVLFDAQGREIWRVVGEMDWNGAEAKARLSNLSG